MVTKVLSEWYDDCGNTEFSQKAQALAEKEGLPIGDATLRLARERPDLATLHDQWQQACSTGDRSALPGWLRVKHYVLFSESSNDDDGETHSESALDIFNAEVGRRVRLFVVGGMSELDAMRKAQDETLAALPPDTRGWLLGQLG